MNLYFAEKAGFLLEGVHEIPVEAVALTQEEYAELTAQHSVGKVLVVRDGKAVAVPPESLLDEAEILAAAKLNKQQEINAAFQLAETQAVQVGGYAFKGGFQSGLALDAQRRMMVEYAAANPQADIDSVDFFDVTGRRCSVPLSSITELDALDICLAVGQIAAINSFKCSQLLAAIEAAASAGQVEAIQW